MNCVQIIHAMCICICFEHASAITWCISVLILVSFAYWCNKIIFTLNGGQNSRCLTANDINIAHFWCHSHYTLSRSHRYPLQRRWMVYITMQIKDETKKKWEKHERNSSVQFIVSLNSFSTSVDRVSHNQDSAEWFE